MSILVGRDGKVVSIHARGPELGPLIEKALAAAVTGGQGAGKSSDGEDKAELKKAREKKKRQEAMLAKAPKFRTWTWTDTSGDFHKTAKFRGAVAGKVKLELEDGSVVTVPLEELSDEDQKYIRERKH